MTYTMTTPCKDCPFLKAHSRAYSMRRLQEFASNQFPCHKSAEIRVVDGDEGGFEEFVPGPNSVHCAGALTFNEKRNQPHQMMRIAERLGRYDRRKLDMTTEVR